MKCDAGMVGKAIYFLPENDRPQMICGRVEMIDHLLDVGMLHRGFLFAPFEQSEQYPMLLIQADECLQGEEAVTSYLSSCDLGLAPNDFTVESSQRSQDFISAVETCVKRIKEDTNLSKVVLSCPLLQKLDDGFSPWKTLKYLHQKMPNAFCFWVTIPNQGTWMGATPERLLEVKDGKAQTNALAATMPADSKREWSPKEIDEQQIVTDYIAAHLAQAKILNYKKTGPETISSGAVKHLKTVFDFEIKNDKQLSDVVAQLHPTPAVCGMPKADALELIKSLENYPRAYYTGYLGPLGINVETRLFVNLRSMQLAQNMACLYVGAGITEGSNPEKEWEETQVKAQTLLSVIAE